MATDKSLSSGIFCKIGGDMRSHHNNTRLRFYDVEQRNLSNGKPSHALRPRYDQFLLTLKDRMGDMLSKHVSVLKR